MTYKRKAEDRNKHIWSNNIFFWTLVKENGGIDLLLPLSVDQTNGYLINKTLSLLLLVAAEQGQELHKSPTK